VAGEAAAVMLRPGDERVIGGWRLVGSLAEPGADTPVEVGGLPGGDCGHVEAPVRVGEDLGERDGFREGDDPRAERRVWSETGGPGPPAGAEPGPAVRFPCPGAGDVPGSLDAVVGPLRIAAAQAEPLEAAVGGQDLGDGGNAGVGGPVRGSEPALAAAAYQRGHPGPDQGCRLVQVGRHLDQVPLPAEGRAHHVLRQGVQQPVRRHHRPQRHGRARPDHREVRRGQQERQGHHRGLPRVRQQPHRCPGQRHHLVLSALEHHPVPDPQDPRPLSHARPPRRRPHDRPVAQHQRQVRRQFVPPHQVKQRRQRGQRVPGHLRAIDKPPRLREHLPQQGRRRFVMTPRVPVAGQPAQVSRLHRVGRALHGIPPAEYRARVPCRRERLEVPLADPVQRPRAHHQRPAVGQPGEEIRRVPAHLAPGPPQQPERLRRHRGHRRVKVEGDQVIALDP
jgi:hypothetical protein